MRLETVSLVFVSALTCCLRWFTCCWMSCTRSPTKMGHQWSLSPQLLPFLLVWWNSYKASGCWTIMTIRFALICPFEWQFIFPLGLCETLNDISSLSSSACIWAAAAPSCFSLSVWVAARTRPPSSHVPGPALCGSTLLPQCKAPHFLHLPGQTLPVGAATQQVRENGEDLYRCSVKLWTCLFFFFLSQETWYQSFHML